MTNAVLVGLGVLVGAVIGWIVGGRKVPTAPSRSPQEDLPRFLGRLRERVLSGQGESDPEGGDPALREVEEILLRDWVPRGKENTDVVTKALSRLAIYVRSRVEAPLLKGLDEGGQALADGADEALGAVEDLEFFLEAPDSSPELEPWNLSDLVQEVVEEFGDQSPVSVTVTAPPDPIPVRINVERLKDAVFLILHNAAEFGNGAPVQVTLRGEGNRAIVRIRDQGPGFSSEALMEALTSFYSTSPEGLGLGLPHARNAVKAQGGEILLRNPQGGGGEVEILLPRAE
jgi:signal transduction histidine kinase